MVSQGLSSSCVLLEDARPGRESVRLFRTPSTVLCAREPFEVAPVLAAAEDALAAGRHVAGYFAYELGYLFERKLEPLLRQRPETPLLWLGVFEGCETMGPDDARNPIAGAGAAHAGPLRFEWAEADYARRFRGLHDLIAAGDLYQANLTFRAGFAFLGDAKALYRDLRARAAAGYCAFVDDGARQILSLSPELFFETTPEGVVRAMPMKGTAARGTDPASDARARAALAASEKDRAENLMIVDLLRNDLSRIAGVGSVAVERLFDIETYPTVHQLVSTVAARMRKGTRPTDILRALFPCGSVTGAPKIRAMEVVRALEQSPRGVYCGAIGAFSPDGSARFAVAIRTLTIEGRRGELGIGGGVVHDSTAAREYAEALLKARYFEAARRPLHLIETLRWSPDTGFARLDRHLARMARSAAVFDIPFDEPWLRQRMTEAVAGARGPMRVRATLADTGEADAAAVPLDDGAPARWTYRIAPDPVDSADIFLRHKTSRRTRYDEGLARAARAGVDEMLFLNERGEIAEGCRTNVFAEIDGRLVTPPQVCGLLDGCLRRELIDTGRCDEAVLFPRDLRRARRVFLGNSLRGLIPADEAHDEAGQGASAG